MGSDASTSSGTDSISWRCRQRIAMIAAASNSSAPEYNSEPAPAIANSRGGAVRR